MVAPLSASPPRFAFGLDPRAGWIIAIAAAALVVIAVAAFGWVLPLAVIAAVALLLATLREPLIGAWVAIALASFVDYNGGQLTLQLAILTAWCAWVALSVAWRRGRLGWTLPPREIVSASAIWLAVLAVGAVGGYVSGYRPRDIGLELYAFFWPVLALLFLQIFRRRSLGASTLAISIIGMMHVVFGLTMLKIFQARVGGVYFTMFTSFVTILLWTVAILTPSNRVRIACLAGMIPNLMHLFFSFTRGYWFGCIAGLVVASVLAWRFVARHDPAAARRRLAILPAFTAALAVAALLSVLYFGQEEILASAGSRLGTSFSTESAGETASNIYRLVEYDETLYWIFRSPVWGYGLGRTILMRDPFFGTKEEHWFIHNSYLLLLLKLGAIGLFAFGYLLWQNVRVARRLLRRERDPWVVAWSVAAIAITADLLVISLTNYAFMVSHSTFVLAAFWATVWAIAAEPPPPPAAICA